MFDLAELIYGEVPSHWQLLRLGELVKNGQADLQCSILTEAREPRTFESHLIRCRIDPDKAEPWFYFYYFWSTEGRSRIESLIEQVAAAGIRGSDLAKLRVLVPPTKIQ